MKYYLCIIGHFEGAPTIYKECIERQIYQYHETTRQKGPARNIDPGDTLILVYDKQLKGYGIAAGGSVASNKGHDENWYTIPIRDGWQLVQQDIPLPYGVYWHTIRGTKQSIVKELDSAWSVEILLQLKRLRHEGIEEKAFPVHLSELATGLNTPNPYYKIPDIQRGLVWNATRCEVLWDSILRGIPIGAISVRPTADFRWEIFDGQQRSNAVAMGYAEWSNDKRAPILWIDLKPQHTRGRRFVLMVTTPAHPWGYNLSNNEKEDNRLSVWEQRNAVELLNGAWSNAGKKGDRPLPCELWPVKAGFPVPFSVLRKYVEECLEEQVSFEGFSTYCTKHYANCNWFQGFQTGTIPAQEVWGEIISAIKELSKYTVVALNGANVRPDDLGLYFKRMNKQGMEPDDEEIQYSLLKSKIPELKNLDTLAEGRTRPAWLANIAVRLWLSRQNDWKWTRRFSEKDIQLVAERYKEFVDFLDTQFPELLKRLDAILMPDKNGLLHWHVSELYRYGYGDCLVLYFLREIMLGHSCESFVPLATAILWFGHDVPQCAQLLWEESPNIQMGLFLAIREGALARIIDIDDAND